MSEPKCSSGEVQHTVTVSSIYMAEPGASRKDYQAVTGTNPSEVKVDDLPVTNITWYQQPAACILMLNTGLRTGELLGLLNSDIDLEHKYLEVRQGVKEVCKRDGVEYTPGREVKVGKIKTATSNAPTTLTSLSLC